MFVLAQHLHPHLAVIDGYEGMEGNGPVSGTPVSHRVAVVGLDWLAADRVAVELMGIDYTKVGSVVSILLLIRLPKFITEKAWTPGKHSLP
jgi:uncharacterized protein (DUF362 family)